MTILVVEDEKKLVDIIKRGLKSERYSVDVAYDGQVGLEKALKNNYSLILLDIMLPKKDGLQILRDNKETPSKLPIGGIVVLTNLGQDAIIKQCFELGADGYLIKSALNPDQVLTEIKSYLSKPSNG